MTPITKAIARITGRHRVTNAEASRAAGGRPRAKTRGHLMPLATLIYVLFAALKPLQQVPPGNGQQGQGGGEGAGGGQQQGQGQGGNGQQQGNGQPPATPITWTPEQQAEIDRIAARARTEGRRAGETEAETRARQAQEERDRTAQEQQQQYQPLYETERTARAADRQKFEQRLITQAVQAEAAQMGFYNPALATSIIDRAAITVGADFAVSGVREALDAVVKDNGYLVRPAAGTGTGQQQGGGTGQGAGQGQNNQRQPIPGTPQAAANGVILPGEQMTPEERAHIDAIKAAKRTTGVYH